MCIICQYENDIEYIINIKKIHCFDCKNVKYIPKELIQLEVLYCNNTDIIEIPKELISLKKLNVNECKIKNIPSTLVNLEILYCNDTLIENIPDNLSKLKQLHCERSNIKYINNDYIDTINVIDCIDLMAINTKYRRIFGLETCISMIDLKKIKKINMEINKSIIDEVFSPERIYKFILKHEQYWDKYGYD